MHYINSGPSRGWGRRG